MKYIYCCTNKINGHVYVGQTNDVARRMREHLSNAYNINSNSYANLFHTKIREYTIENFVVTILESYEGENEIEWANEREIYWISKLNAYCRTGTGYNMTLGGENKEHNRIYSLEVIKQVKLLLKEGHSFKEINELLGISFGYISGINTGLYFYDETINYPIRKFYSSEEETQTLIEEIKNSPIPLTQIAKNHNKSYSTIKKINSGALSHQHQESYPLRKETAQALRAKRIKELLVTTSLTYEEIAKETLSSKITVQRINNGESFKDDFRTYPLR